jgi:hypothetical protein
MTTSAGISNILRDDQVKLNVPHTFDPRSLSTLDRNGHAGAMLTEHVVEMTTQRLI